MTTTAFADTAKVMSKGQVTIPKDVRAALGSGDKVTFIVEGNVVRVVNAAVYAMQALQAQMAGAADMSGPEDVDALVAQMRAEA